MSERPQNEEEDPLLKPGEIGRMLGVSARTVSLWAIAGKLPVTMTPGGHRRFRESDVRKLLEPAPED